MPTLDQLISIVKAGESEILEFKRSTGAKREAIHTLCAMLNTRGGRVIFGVEADKSIVGQQVGAKTIEDVSREIREIEPPVFPSIDRVTVSGERDVLVVSVLQGSTRPYTVRGKAYFRVGNTTVEMSRDEHNRMLFERMHSEQRWENQVAHGWLVSDLDVGEVTRTLEEAIRRGRQGDPGTRDPMAVLRGLGLMRDGDMLRAAAVLFGKRDSVEARLPQCLLRVAKFRGVDKSEFVDNRQFHGNAFRLLNQAGKFLRESLPVAGRVTPGLFERADDPLYPFVALREALANAICHRDYTIGGGSIAIGIFEDRLEITSSGTLHFGLTSEVLFQDHESLPWNPLMADVFYRRGIVERWGRGTLIMADLAQRAGLPRPEIEESAGCVVVRFRPSGYVPPERVQTTLSDHQRTLLALLDSGGALALRDLRAQLPERPEWAIKEDLSSLKGLGLIRIAGHGRGAYWFRTDQ